jgi:hypothetical protein
MLWSIPFSNHACYSDRIQYATYMYLSIHLGGTRALLFQRRQDMDNYSTRTAEA